MRKKTVEIALYAAIFCLAIIQHFYQLGISPLSEGEAAAAINAFHLSKGLDVIFDAQTGYVLLTSVLFYFLKASEFWARFLPAIVGSLIVFTPILYKKHLGDLPALLLAFGLAIDPGLIITSRMADGSVFGITFFLFAMGFLINGRSALAGVFGALALLGGPSVWFGLSVSLLTGAGYFTFRKTGKTENQKDHPIEEKDGWNFKWKHFLTGFGITAFLVFSAFLTTPEGLGGLFSGLAAFVEGWSLPQAMSISTTLWSLIFYEALPVLLGIVAIVIAFQRRDPIIVTLSFWSLASLILILLYPARGFSLFPWMTIPLWGLLGKYILADYSLADVEKIPYLGLFVMILIAFVFSGMNLKGIFTGSVVDNTSMQLRIVSILGSLLIIILAAGLTIWEWSVSTATRALFGAVFILLFANNISTIWNILTSPTELKQEVWLSNNFVDEDLFTKTLADYQRWNIGTGNQLSVLISGIDSKALEWSLRMNDNIEPTQVLPATFDPEMVITNSSEQLLLENQYAGQDFILSREPVWDDLDTWGWFRWFFVRETPYIDKSIILWVRVDQFPGYEANELLPTN